MNDRVVHMIFGSHLYGLNHADSDEDFKGVVFPTAKQIIMQEADFQKSSSTGDNHSKNGAGDVDETFFSLSKFLKLALKGETIAIDMLHAPQDKINDTSPIWKELVSLRHLFYTKNMKAYIGYVRKQAAKYGVKGSRLAALSEAIKVIDQFTAEGKNQDVSLAGIEDRLPLGEHAILVESYHQSIGPQKFYEICGRKFQLTNKLPYARENMQKIYDAYGVRARQAESNEGVDWKAISHALRAGYQAKHIYSEGGFEYPLPETDFLMDVKLGKLDWNTVVQPKLEALVDEVDVLAAESDYPDKVDHTFWNNWLYEQHLQIVRNAV